jgi:hypothetical protein
MAANQVDVMADSALLGPAGPTLAGLSVRVQFGAGQKATWKLSSSDVPLVVWARLFRLDDRHKAAVDAFGFESDGPGGRPRSPASDPPPSRPTTCSATSSGLIRTRAANRTGSCYEYQM